MQVAVAGNELGKQFLPHDMEVAGTELGKQFYLMTWDLTMEVAGSEMGKQPHDMGLARWEFQDGTCSFSFNGIEIVKLNGIDVAETCFQCFLAEIF